MIINEKLIDSLCFHPKPMQIGRLGAAGIEIELCNQYLFDFCRDDFELHFSNTF